MLKTPLTSDACTRVDVHRELSHLRRRELAGSKEALQSDLQRVITPTTITWTSAIGLLWVASRGFSSGGDSVRAQAPLDRLRLVTESETVEVQPVNSGRSSGRLSSQGAGKSSLLAVISFAISALKIKREVDTLLSPSARKASPATEVTREVAMDANRDATTDVTRDQGEIFTDPAAVKSK